MEGGWGGRKTHFPPKAHFGLTGREGERAFSRVTGAWPTGREDAVPPPPPPCIFMTFRERGREAVEGERGICYTWLLLLLLPHANSEEEEEANEPQPVGDICCLLDHSNLSWWWFLPSPHSYKPLVFAYFHMTSLLLAHDWKIHLSFVHSVYKSCQVSECNRDAGSLSKEDILY